MASKGDAVYNLYIKLNLLNSLINGRESCGQSEGEREVSDNSDSSFSDESNTETIDFVAPDELLDDSAIL